MDFLEQVEHKKLTRLITMMTNKVCIHVLTYRCANDEAGKAPERNPYVRYIRCRWHFGHAEFVWIAWKYKMPDA